MEWCIRNGSIDNKHLHTHHLFGCHYDSLDAELSPAHIKEVFQARPQQVDDQNIMQAFLSKIIDLGDTGCKLNSFRL